MKKNRIPRPTRADVMSAEGFDRFAFGLAKVLGARLRVYPDNWREQRTKLRRAVLMGH